MCTLAMAISGLGTAFSAVSSLNAGKQAQAQSEYQAAMARQNAELERRKSDDALERGRLEEAGVRERGRQFTARMRAGLASSGTEISTGSPLVIQVDSAGMTAADAAKTRYNSQMESWGYLANASEAEGRARQYEAEGEAASKAGKVGAFTSLLTGASSLAGQWDYWKGGGGPGGSVLGSGLSSKQQALMYPDFTTRRVYGMR